MAKKMKALRLYGARDLRFDEIARPSPKKGEVLIKIMRVGICGSDLHYYQDGRCGDVAVSPDKPLILGHEFAGEIAELGKGVRGFKEGDRVIVEPGITCGKCEMCKSGRENLCYECRFFGSPPQDGALREFVAHPAPLVKKFKKSLDYQLAACAEPLSVGLHALALACFKKGETAAVLGAGPIGLLIIACLRRAGAKKIIATEILANRLAAAKVMGADTVLNPRDGSEVEAIMKLTGGRGVDAAFEAAGEPETFQNAILVARRGGRAILAGITRDNVVPLDMAAARRRELVIQCVRRSRGTNFKAITLIEKGGVDVAPIVTHSLPFADARRAFEAAEKKSGSLKVQVVFE